jgi:hypothetical protein
MKSSLNPGSTPPMGAPSPELVDLWLARAFNAHDVEAAAAMYHPEASVVRLEQVHGSTIVARGADEQTPRGQWTAPHILRDARRARALNSRRLWTQSRSPAGRASPAATSPNVWRRPGSATTGTSRRTMTGAHME